MIKQFHFIQEMVWQIVHDFNPENGQRQLKDRFPFIESEMFDEEELTFQQAKEMKSPRLIKTHLPFSMLPPDLIDVCKVFFVARNPKVKKNVR